MASKYGNSFMVKKPRKPKTPHPIWRGIGFALIILIPIISWALVDLFIQENGKRGWIPLPAEFIVNYPADPLILIKLLFTVACILVLFALSMLIYFFINSVFGTPRYGPLDAPPINYKRRR